MGPAFDVEFRLRIPLPEHDRSRSRQAGHLFLRFRGRTRGIPPRILRVRDPDRRQEEGLDRDSHPRGRRHPTLARPRSLPGGAPSQERLRRSTGRRLGALSHTRRGGHHREDLSREGPHGGPGRGRKGHAHEEPIPREHESRDHGRPIQTILGVVELLRETELDYRAVRLREPGPVLRRRPPGPHQRRPRLLQDRGRAARAGDDELRPPVLGASIRRPSRDGGEPQGSRDHRRRRRRAPRPRARRSRPPAADHRQPVQERRQIHPRRRDKPVSPPPRLDRRSAHALRSRRHGTGNSRSPREKDCSRRFSRATSRSRAGPAARASAWLSPATSSSSWAARSASCRSRPRPAVGDPRSVPCSGSNCPSTLPSTRLRPSRPARDRPRARAYSSWTTMPRPAPSPRKRRRRRATASARREPARRRSPPCARPPPRATPSRSASSTRTCPRWTDGAWPARSPAIRPSTRSASSSWLPWARSAETPR